MADFNYAIEKVLVNEGGLVDDPQDNGGLTKYGLSQRAYPDLDICNLTVEQAKKIYKRDYWDKIKGDDIISNNIAYEIFDTAVNMGVRTASKLAQTAVEAHPDGFIGKNTLEKLNSINKELFLLRFKLAKIARYVSLANKRPANRKFLRGWLNRVLGA